MYISKYGYVTIQVCLKWGHGSILHMLPQDMPFHKLEVVSFSYRLTTSYSYSYNQLIS